jgi:hypothetical protein
VGRKETCSRSFAAGAAVQREGEGKTQEVGQKGVILPGIQRMAQSQSYQAARGVNPKEN